MASAKTTKLIKGVAGEWRRNNAARRAGVAWRRRHENSVGSENEMSGMEKKKKHIAHNNENSGIMAGNAYGEVAAIWHGNQCIWRGVAAANRQWLMAQPMIQSVYRIGGVSQWRNINVGDNNRRKRQRKWLAAAASAKTSADNRRPSPVKNISMAAITHRLVAAIAWPSSKRQSIAACSAKRIARRRQ